MSSSFPLTGLELVNCAKANATDGASVAAQQCGYGEDITAFRAALKVACADMAIEVESIADLITPQQRIMTEGGQSIAPDTYANL